MRKKETIGENKSYQAAMKDLLDRRILILEARYALQKVLAAEEKNTMFPPVMTADLKECFEMLEPSIDCIDYTIKESKAVEELPSSEIQTIVLKKLAQSMSGDEWDEKEFEKILKELDKKHK